MSEGADIQDSPFPSGEPDRSLRLSILEGCISTVHGALVGGSLITAYALMLGANDFAIGLLGGMGMISTIGLLAGARLSIRDGRRKPLVVRAALTGRLLWSALCLLPFIPIASGLKLAVFLLLVLLAQFLLQMAVNPWTSWMSDLVPEERRGRYFGLRNTICGAVGMLASYAIGSAFDTLKLHIGSAGLPAAWGYVPFFGAAALFAITAGVMYARQWEPAMRGEKILPLARMLADPLRYPPFRTLIQFQVLWALVCAVAGPFFGAHMIKNLHMSMSTIAIYGILAGAVGIVSQPMWGRIVDRVGNRPVIVFNMLGIFTMPFIWLFATPAYYWPVWIDALLTGLCWPGFNLAMFNLVLATAPIENRQSYLASQGMIAGAAQFVAALIGGALAHVLSGLHWVIGPQTIVNFHALFIISGFGRLSLIPLAMRLHEPRAQPVGAVISSLAGIRDKFTENAIGLFGNGVAVVARRIRNIPRPGSNRPPPAP